MRKTVLAIALLAATPLVAEEKPAPALSPTEIVEAAPAADWTDIAPADLLVMELAPDAKGRARRVVIQLMPPPFSQGWIGNIRKLAAAHWWDGLSVNRVQDNYVVQWGDASEKKALPEGLVVVPGSDYSVTVVEMMLAIEGASVFTEPLIKQLNANDIYAKATGFSEGWPVAMSRPTSPIPREMVRRAKAKDLLQAWPVHCYATVGVGRNLPPDTGSGAELYTVIGHAPRHLDRNIAVIGRVIEGIEHLSSLPRGTGALGFYETAAERAQIVSVRLGTELRDLPRFEYLSTESETFARYADARANRRDAFFVHPAGGADICNIPVPVRRSTLRPAQGSR